MSARTDHPLLLPPLWRPAEARRLALATHAGAWAICTLLVTAIFLVEDGGYFWPRWVCFAGAVTVGLHALVATARAAGPVPQRWVAIHGALAVLLSGAVLAVWAMTGGGAFWPRWPIAAATALVLLHAIVARHGWLPPGVRARVLARRVDELTRTRRGVLDVQAAEMRRIERDLHDGAQARLVALTMLLGRAEEQLDGAPAADLVRRARGEASAAIAELRDLARGIAPPVLADRGLVAAVEALGKRSGVDVAVEADLPDRPLPVIEAAAYFVVAEALTNVAKHAGSRAARVALREIHGILVIEVADEGRGGADATGNGLAGLRQRVEALDGRLAIASPPAGGTIVRAEIPCES